MKTPCNPVPLQFQALGEHDVERQARRRQRDRGKAPASSNTLNRLELTPAAASDAHRGAGVRFAPSCHGTDDPLAACARAC